MKGHVVITANQYKLSWEHFNHINQDKRLAFENLCRSIFIRTQCQEGVNVHSNPNNPGIEIEPVKSKNGNERISFQAKFFEGRLGYKEIEGSMRTAVKYYSGKLDKIFLYCNKDIHNTSVQYKRIEDIVAPANIEIVLVTGQSILDIAMNYPTVLACYFGIDSLSKEWFSNNLNISLNNLGKRYNPKFNIDTEAQRKLSIFLREIDGIKMLNNKKKEAIEKLEKIKQRCNEKYRKYVYSFILTIEKLPDASKGCIENALQWRCYFLTENEEILSELNKIEITLQNKLETIEKYDTYEYFDAKNELNQVELLLSTEKDLAFDKKEEELITNQILIITGEMGTGKSQLLSTAAKRMFENDCLALLILGQVFISDQPIEAQILSSTENAISEASLESIIAVMDEHAYINNGISVIFIDAINESRYRDIWKTGINRLFSTIKKYKNVQLIISMRNGFESLLLSDKVIEDIEKGKVASFEHKGLLDKSPEGIFEFLSHFGVSVSAEYYLRQEMGNPLFLTWFCQTFNGKNQGLALLISNVIKKVDEEASLEAGYISLGLLEELLREFVNKNASDPVSKKRILGFTSWDLYGVTNKIAYINAVERAGILSTFVSNREEIYYIGYNLLEDYIRANCIIEKYNSKEKLMDYCEKELMKIDSDGDISNSGNESVFSMTAALYAIYSGEELIEVFDKINNSWEKDTLIEEYIKILIWSNSSISFDHFMEMVQKYQLEPKTVWKLFIENATRVECEINADGLTKLLMEYPINKRDYLWTIHINDMTSDERIISLAYYIESGKEIIHMTDEKTLLLLTLYTWFLSSSNRELRDRISKAMIEILKVRFNLCVVLLERFKAVNDPYIVQRLYGIIFGAVMKRKGLFAEEYECLAIYVYTVIFSKSKVYPDILLRDYARLIVDRFVYEFPEKTNKIDVEKIKPPYCSDPIPDAEVVDYSDENFHKSGMGRLLFSMKFDMDVKGCGMYGDFGRYVFQCALRHFVGVDMQNIYYYALQFIIKDLGYSNELFGHYDGNLVEFHRKFLKRLERIGKKYEWIAMYNILARLSDTHKVESYNWNDKLGEPYNGPWNPYVRDFDPTLNCRYMVNSDFFPCFENEDLFEESFIDENATEEEIDKWVSDDAKMFSEITHRLVMVDSNGVEWVSLYSFQEKKKLIPRVEGFSGFFPRGEQTIWSMSALHIVEDDKELTLEKLWGSEFVKHRGDLTRDCYSLFCREYAWSPRYKYVFNDYEIDDEDPIKAIPATINFMWEEQYDASYDEAISFMIPTGEIIQELGLYEKEIDGVYYYNDEIVAYDRSIIDGGHSELLLRRDVLNAFLEKRNVRLFWDVIGEKQYFLERDGQKWQRKEGHFLYGKTSIVGNIKNVPNL